MEIKLPFDKCYCLHLSEASDRYENLINEFNNLGIKDKVEIWWTSKKPINIVIGNNIESLKTEYYERLYKQNKNIYSRVFDCAYNHYSIIKQAYERGLNNILIIEDDIYFNKNKNIINNIFNIMPNNYKMIRFYTTYNYFETNKNNNKEISYITRDDEYFYEMCNSSLCYALSNEGMKIVIDEYEKCFQQPDVILNNICWNYSLNDNIYILKYNLLCNPGFNKSYINNE